MARRVTKEMQRVISEIPHQICGTCKGFSDQFESQKILVLLIDLAFYFVTREDGKLSSLTSLYSEVLIARRQTGNGVRLNINKLNSDIACIVYPRSKSLIFYMGILKRG